MDRETTQRLLKESIIFLCRTYIGVVSDFEVDGIICISRDDGTSEQHVVFKIHELVAKQEEAQASYPEVGFGKEDSLESTLPSENSRVLVKCVGSKKRKLGSHMTPYHNMLDYCKGDSNMVSCENPQTVFPELKKESSWLNDLCSGNNEDALVMDDLKTATKVVDSEDNLQTYSCNGCDFSCLTKKMLDKHMLSFHGQMKHCFCVFCNISFTTKENFDAHRLLVHHVSDETGGHDSKEGYESNEDVGDVMETSSNEKPNQVISSAPIFPISSRTHQVVKNCRPVGSVRMTGDYPMTETFGLTNNDKLLSVQHQEIPGDEDSYLDQNAPRDCTRCNLQFSNFPAFNIHCKVAHETFACPYCVKTFDMQLERDNHLFKHTGEKPYECPECSLSFSRLDSLRRHRVKVHDLSWADVCTPESEIVAPDLVESADLEPEKDVSDGFKSANDSFGNIFEARLGSTGWGDGGFNVAERQLDVSCSLPGSGSCQSSDAIEISDDESCIRSSRNRYRNVKTLDPNRVFICEICQETVVGVTSFREHCDTIHRRVPCPFCGATFTQKASMERHQRQHTGERPFKCQFCDHTYTRKENLQTHMIRLHPLLM